MPLNRQYMENIANGRTITVKRGAGIFEGTDVLPDLNMFIGQDTAKAILELAITSARMRETRLDHILLASGSPGIGKSSLARLIAYEANRGLVEASGAITAQQAEDTLTRMTAGDIWFLDEIHSLTRRCTWLLPLMTEGTLLTPTGPVEVPQVTIVGATTDQGRLSEAILSRFLIKPRFVDYTDKEGAEICDQLTARLGIKLDWSYCKRIACASNNNPRTMRSILVPLRDMIVTGKFDFDLALKYAGLTEDGLDHTSQELLLALLGQRGYTASEATLRAVLGEPGPIGFAEKILLQRGYLTISTRGKTLTVSGQNRARELIDEA